MKQMVSSQSEFQEDELITWHNYQGMKCIPVPGVVVSQNEESVLIRTRVEGLLKELRVDPKQLAHR